MPAKKRLEKSSDSSFRMHVSGEVVLGWAECRLHFRREEIVAHDLDGSKKDADIVHLFLSKKKEDVDLATEMACERYKNRLCGYLEAAYPGLKYHDTEDIFQQTIKALLRKIEMGKFTAEGSFGGLLFKIGDCFAISSVRWISRRPIDGAVDVADVAMARYHEPHKLRELRRAIRQVAQEQLTLWERRVFETRMEFVRQKGRTPSMKKLTELVKGRPGSTAEVEAVKQTYYRALAKLEAHLTRLRYWP